MLTIDGSGGGGQLLRTALSLSTLTDTPFRITDIRGARPNPGLRPQHLAAVETVGAFCDAEVDGAALESETLTFQPGSISRTDLQATVGTAGSVTLVFDTILPIAAIADQPVTVTATGGTDVKWAPTVGYYQLVKRPLLADHGVTLGIDVARSGFYPAGGGEAMVRITPGRLTPFALDTRGDLHRLDIYSKASEDLEDAEVATRQARHVQDTLADAGYPVEVRSIDYVSSASPGSSVVIRGEYDDTVVGFDAIGEPGKPSETVAEEAIEEFSSFHETSAAVDRFMADQLMVLLAVVGGHIHVPEVTDHVRTNLEIINTFGSDMHVDTSDETSVLRASADAMDLAVPTEE